MRTLYHLALSPFSRKVRVVLREKNLDFELKVEKVWERRPEFLAMNPAGTVPEEIAGLATRGIAAFKVFMVVDTGRSYPHMPGIE